MLDRTSWRSVKDKSSVTVEQVYGANAREEILRLRNTVRQEFGSLYDRSLRILSTSDPIGLLSLPGISPEDSRDEYAPEVETILLRLREADSRKALRRIVYQEFQHWFSPKIAGPESRYEKVATGIWNTSRSHRSRKQNLPRPRLGLVRQSAEGLPVAVDDLPRFLVSDATAGSAAALSD